MSPDTVLELGDFAFGRFEVPETLPFGGDQRISVHEMVGGVRVVDSLGAAPAPIEWSGFFTGEQAVYRAQNLDYMRKAGKPLHLRWNAFTFTVVIRSLKCDFQNFHRIPYRIECVVVEDRLAPVTASATPSLDEALLEDAANAAAQAAKADALKRIELGIAENGELPSDQALGPLIETMDKAIKGVSDFAKASQSVINGVLGPINAVRQRADMLHRATDATIRNIATVGGELPDSAISQAANRVLSQVTAARANSVLFSLGSTTGRMQQNLTQVNVGSRRKTVAGGDLMRMASQQYGDPMAWTAIAQANGLTDPKVTGIKTLKVPPLSVRTGGLLNG